MKRLVAGIASGIVVFTMASVLSACEKEGPAERAGKSIDNAVNTAGEKIEKAGEKIQDAAKGNDDQDKK